MANQKLTDRIETETSEDNDLIHIVKSGVSFKIKKSNFVSGSVIQQQVTATASQTVITLTRNAKTLDVYVDRVYQIKGIDYNHTEDTNTLTFTNGLDADSIVNIRLF